MAPSPPPALGLVAGDGDLPGEMAREARRRGRRVAAVALRGITRPELEAEVDEWVWLELGQLEGLRDWLRRQRVDRAVLAGKVSKEHLLVPGRVPVSPDASARALLARLPDQRDDSLLGALAGWLEGQGIRLLSQGECAPALLPEAGILGARAPGEGLRRDVAFAWPLAKALAGLDVGQTVVVRERAVTALEAIEGTDAAIRRGGSLAGPGAVAVKVAKPHQDPRFDLPTLGPGTLEAALEAGLAGLVFEAGATLVLDRPGLVRRADREGLVLWALPAAGPPAEAPSPSGTGGE